TPLCDLLGIEHPIVQSGMGSAAGPELAAEVSRAGGLGIVAGLGVTADELRKRIRHVRSVTDRPFGVNQWLHTELRPPVDPGRVPVVAAGGTADGRGCVGGRALGGVGARLGTRFGPTRASMASEVWKKRLLGSDGGTPLTEAYTGLWARSPRSRFTEDYAAS